MEILIVKTSSLGDIIQSFPVLDYLHHRFPDVQIDWAVEASLQSIVAAHPKIRRSIPLDLKGLKKTAGWKTIFSAIRNLRSQTYDIVFDLQRNTKSGFVTLLARSPLKVGFGRRCVREWPNLLATHRRYDVSKSENIRLQYIGLLQQAFQDAAPFPIVGVRFKMNEEGAYQIQSILSRSELTRPFRVMVCPGSRWVNKKLPLETMIDFLARLIERFDASFFLMWGDATEKSDCAKIQERFPDRSAVVDKLSLEVWQNLMNEMQLVIAVDSSALHLCGTAKVASFSLFGPTDPNIFKPIGERHFAIQGPCPYGKPFEKQCPALRTCPTGACIRELKGEEIFRRFLGWWETI